jgi:hypothetical protein
MALSSPEKKEIENIIRKEIKSFMGNSTIKQFEDKFMDKIQKEIKRGRLESGVKDITQKMFSEFYQLMWSNRTQLGQKLKNA